MKISPLTKKNNVEKKVASFLKNNPEVEKTLKIFNMNLNEYTEAIRSISYEQPITNYKNTKWLPGNR